MKITILNGNPQPSPFDAYLAELAALLEGGAHSVTRIDLRSIPLRHCIGCWGCWVKTPGLCTCQDASLAMDQAVIASDFTLWASPLKMGFPSELLKMALDKHLPLVHPYLVIDQGEVHHLPRYPRSPRLGLLLEKDAALAGTGADDLQIVSDIHCRTALNFKSRLEFSLTSETPPADLAARITARHPAALPLPARPRPIPGVTIAPPARLALFNGSPRGRKGNTPLMLEQLALGFGGPVETYHLVQMKQTDEMVQAFAQAECAILGFPLYTDAMPAVVKHFIEALEPLVGRQGNPPLAFLVQSGFPEGLHSRYVERYLHRLAARLGSLYLGTLVKGGGEGTRHTSPEMNRPLFTTLQALGAGLAAQGRLDPAALARLATPEQIPAFLSPLLRLMTRLSASHGGFDEMLKRNGVFDQRFARPFKQ